MRLKTLPSFVLAVILLTACQPAPIPRVENVQTYTYFFPLMMNNQVTAVVSKKGVGMPYPICADLGASWLYDWSANPPDCGVESVPMAYSGTPAALGGNSRWLMGFNEPDQPTQANLTPLIAAREWRILETAYPDKFLVAPVPSQANKQWLVDFRNAYIAEFGEVPRLDALAEHCYAWADLGATQTCKVEAIWYFARMQEWNVPQLWVTEWAFFECHGFSNEGQVISEMGTFIDWMNGETRVGRFSWFASRIIGNEPWAFGACNPTLTSPSGLNNLGAAYRVK